MRSMSFGPGGGEGGGGFNPTEPTNQLVVDDGCLAMGEGTTGMIFRVPGRKHHLHHCILCHSIIYTISLQF